MYRSALNQGTVPSICLDAIVAYYEKCFEREAYLQVSSPPEPSMDFVPLELVHVLPDAARLFHT